MNRYSLIFALLVASSFAVHPPQAGEGYEPPEKTKTSAAALAAKTTAADNRSVLGKFMEKAQSDPKQKIQLQVLFATVPHPVETHLASEFDNDVSALVDGLQDSGYLFDSSWIPWNHHAPRDQFNDDIAEKNLKGNEDNTPGILLFRKNTQGNDSYTSGIIVFLLSEKPTEGIAFTQVSKAVTILRAINIYKRERSTGKIDFPGPLRILGPTFSGSFASLVPIINYLNTKFDFPAGEKILIRSGSATVGKDAVAAMETIANQLPSAWVDFGSAEHDDGDWTQAAARALCRMGIEPDSVATLNEGESAFGILNPIEQHVQKNAVPQDSQIRPQCPAAADRDEPIDISAMLRLSYPRDISSLRADYVKQGIFDATTPTQPWKRSLNLKSDEQNDGDSVRSFGGENTLAAQEAILFGISEFLKRHGIRAVMISASNEEDQLFLTQFLHVHNGNVRVVLVGATRAFMRGSTAQFRGDLMVDSFPMLPRLHDWTGGADDHSARVFPDYEAQGTYFAAIDLFAPRQSSDGSNKWYPEYSAPVWAKDIDAGLRPPMYVVALGGNDTWPVAEDLGNQFTQDDPDPFRVTMPFTLFAHNPPSKAVTPQSGDSAKIHAGHEWKDLFVSLIVLAGFYCLCFWYAKPVGRSLFASFEPSPEWRFWLFKVTIPAAVAGCAFKVLAWAIDLPVAASSDAAYWHGGAEFMTVLAPLGIALSAVIKAVRIVKPGRAINGDDPLLIENLKRVTRTWKLWMWISFVPALVTLVWSCISSIASNTPDTNKILNTYREMHWLSGLSLLPTWMFFLLAFLVWASQAGNGAALFEEMPQLPEIVRNPRISQDRAYKIHLIGIPLPFNREAIWLWVAWSFLALAIVLGNLFFPPFTEITTLEPLTTTYWVRGVAAAIMALILLDVLQFLELWNELRGLLRSLNSVSFKRSFVPINDFNWRQLWSISGISLHNRMAILGAQIKYLNALKEERGFSPADRALDKLIGKYRKIDLSDVDSAMFRSDLKKIYRLLASAGKVADSNLQKWKTTEHRLALPTQLQMLQIALANQNAQKEGRFSDEKEEIERLSQRQRDAEQFLCLLYIGYIQTVIARLHTLLISVGLMFSLAALGVAIYPFTPIAPFLVTGFGMMLLIGWAFFKIFSEMDRDPILSRIVNGDDRKLQVSFYVRFGEAVALPVLTLASSFLPGGAGRLLDLVQTLLSHGQ